jgi:tRNA G18 (ribose-2'-O)-methylase SpoU
MSKKEADAAGVRTGRESKERVVFILGNEVGGLSKGVLDLVDIIAEIPMAGEKESLNVSVAGGIALFRILNK